ncbi:helix-turn-helix domain-containing protein [Paraburkholderia nemoris]|uniref:helix-turn-helix domain-containing protein n=1 Tax=Paraburkholderia nemoris TaxID=2793076 RepID=UPI0038B7B589
MRKNAQKPLDLRITIIVKQIAIALFNGFTLSDVASIAEIFRAANALIGSGESEGTPYEVTLVSASGGRTISSSSVFVWTASVESIRHAEKFRAIFIAEGTSANSACRDHRLIAWLRRACPRSEIVHPVAQGCLLLDAAGFRASIHARTKRDRTGRQPLPENLLGHSLCPLGVALDIVEGDLGLELAQQVAERVSSQGMSQFGAFVRARTVAHISEKIQASTRWLEANRNRRISITDAAQVATMSGRNFLRRFKREMGVTPSEYLLRLRLDMSCMLLVETGMPVDKIGRRCGIGGGDRLAKLFRKYLSTSPTEYRMSKQSLRKE